jgi:hypothetical protein
VYLMVGPIWVAKEIWTFVTGKRLPEGQVSEPAKKS